MKVNVLGTDYTIAIRTHEEEPSFKTKNIDGFENYNSKEIVILNLDKAEQWADETPEARAYATKEITRHEITHAFFDESGLQHSSNAFSGGWATNEEMVDWIALQFPKILKAFQETNCI